MDEDQAISASPVHWMPEATHRFEAWVGEAESKRISSSKQRTRGTMVPSRHADELCQRTKRKTISPLSIPSPAQTVRW